MLEGLLHLRGVNITLTGSRAGTGSSHLFQNRLVDLIEPLWPSCPLSRPCGVSEEPERLVERNEASKELVICPQTHVGVLVDRPILYPYTLCQQYINDAALSSFLARSGSGGPKLIHPGRKEREPPLGGTRM